MYRIEMFIFGFVFLPLVVQGQDLPSADEFGWSGNEKISPSLAPCPVHTESFTFQLLPKEITYRPYLANPYASRLSGVWNSDKDKGWMWDINLGGHAPLLRYGTSGKNRPPQGWQLDIEGNAHLRLDLEHERDVDSVDFHFGIPLSYCEGNWQFRTGYYHISSHLGDERMLRLPNEPRVNYVREAWILGAAYQIPQYGRIYAEADLAFWQGEYTKPWHFLFGAEWTPIYLQNMRTPYDVLQYGRLHGSPFAAVNVRLMQEHNYDGNINVQLGWQWGKGGKGDPSFRIGVQYFGGINEQYEHIHRFREHKVGLGLWYDF